VTDTTDTALAQGKPRCITFILIILCVYIYTCCASTWQEFYGNYIYIYLPISLTSAGSSSALLRFTGSMSNLSVLTTGDYYYY
jgi:hypothetical protein